MTPCKFCGNVIYWKEINGKYRSYDEQAGQYLHKCIKNKNNVSSKPLNISDDLRIIYHILDSHSKQIEELGAKIDSRK
jgi:hypothetical protein